MKSGIALASIILFGNIPEWNDSFIICDNGEDIKGKRSFDVFVGILLGIKTFQILREKLSDIRHA